MSRGGPSKMTPSMERELLRCIRAGMPQARACELLGIAEDTLAKHRKKHAEFYSQLQEALLARERYLLRCISTGAKQWQSRAWLLGKLKPDVYGRKVDEAPPVVLPVMIRTEVEERQPKPNAQAEVTSQDAQAVSEAE